MRLKTELHLSRPGIALPTTRVDNAEIVRRVRENFRGNDVHWRVLNAAIERVFSACNTQVRYLAPNEDERVGDYAVAAARQCLEINGVDVDSVDLVICGGIARQYFEPATAMEVASKLGLDRAHALDVTCACVGHLEAVHAAAGYLTLHEEYDTALLCTAELSGRFLSFDIQGIRELNDKAAGLTIGNGAACFLLRRSPFPGGGIRLVGIDTFAAPVHWDLCKVPIDGHFASSSVQLMRLGKLIPPRLEAFLDRVGWKASEVDHFAVHQPSESMMRKILKKVGADPERAVYTHHLYGNTASASVGLAMHRLLAERTVRSGDRFLLGSAAAGFAMVVATGEWRD